MKPVVRRRMVISAILCLVVVATIYGFYPKPAEVDLAAVSRGAFQVTVEEEGRTRLKDRFVISAPVAGFMRRIDFKVGDPIHKGQGVAILEPVHAQSLDPRSRAEAEATVSAAEASLHAAEERERAARADADYTAKRSERFKNLFSKGALARDQMDQADSEAQKARAVNLSARSAVDVSRAELERAKTSLKTFDAAGKYGKEEIRTVASPVSGRIFKIYRESEGTVNTGEPLMDVGNVENLEVRVEVLSSDAVKIRKGMLVIFKRWGGDVPLQGRVRIVEPAGFTKISSLGVEEQRTLVIADITSPPEQWRVLGDGYRLDAYFVIWEGENILQFPASALFRFGKGWAVFVEDQGRARQRAVEIGQRNTLTVEIVSGLKEGERVIVHPDDTVKDGRRIRARKSTLS